MARLARAGLLLATAVGGLAVLVTATGWLYLMRPAALPGPRIADALPLDELSHRAAVPLAAFLAVWGGAGLLLGGLARVARAERLTSALMLALGVGAWLYATTGISILVVRQVPAADAFNAASRVQAVYLAAAVAGLGGALLGRSRPAATRAPFILAVFVAAAGLLALISAFMPGLDRSLGLVDALLSPARALVAPVGLALVLVARGLARRKRRAWQLAVGLLASATVLHLLKGSEYETATATGLVALALVARRRDFDAAGDPDAPPRLALRAIVFAAAIYAYGGIALFANRTMADRPFSASFALGEVTRSLLGLSLRGSQHLAGTFGGWFPDSLLLLEVVAAASLVLAWLAPWRYRLRQEERERALTRALVAAWGVDTLAPFVLRADKSYFFSETEEAFVAYKVVGGVAVVSGDPVGPPGALPGLLAAFASHARARDWRIAILGASERHLELYRRHGLHALYHGDEAVIDVDRFSLEGRAIRKVRQSVHRLERDGYRAEVLHPREIDRGLRAELEEIARAWRGKEPERGFAMALDALFRLEADEAVFVIGRDPRGRPAGFVHYAVSHAGSALSLSSMPRLRSTPNGFNEWLICETVAWAREHGFACVSLNFSPFAALLAPEAELSSLQRVQKRALLTLKGHFQLDNLLLFNRKFLPRWERRFVVYERRRDLPRVGIAALAAEAYLPFAGREKR